MKKEDMPIMKELYRVDIGDEEDISELLDNYTIVEKSGPPGGDYTFMRLILTSELDWYNEHMKGTFI